MGPARNEALTSATRDGRNREVRGAVAAKRGTEHSSGSEEQISGVYGGSDRCQVRISPTSHMLLRDWHPYPRLHLFSAASVFHRPVSHPIGVPLTLQKLSRHQSCSEHHCLLLLGCLKEGPCRELVVLLPREAQMALLIHSQPAVPICRS